jgi:nucleoside-diphosphate-sugar epimerase
MHVDPNPVVLNTASMEIRDQTLDAGKAHARLGWRASWALEDGLRETVEWYREHLAGRSRVEAGV